MSTVVTSDVPIVSERSMYWPGDATPFGEGHNSSGVVATAHALGPRRGPRRRPAHFTTYILLANPHDDGRGGHGDVPARERRARS